jgi:predicted house-cleaning noncanonical NTP pyrophosphatase (MazG superfamily)
MAGKIYYNKLIRDRIPEKIAAAGADCEIRVLSDAEFAEELVKKVEE